MEAFDAQRRIAALLKRSPRIHRWGRGLLRGWESLKLAPMLGGRSASDWRITRRYQTLYPIQFGEAAHTINAWQGGRVYAIHREYVMVLAAAAFDIAGGPEGALLIRELALARPSTQGGALDPRAYEAAIFLLERLHDVKHKHGAPTGLWLEPGTGATADDCSALGFMHLGFNAHTPPFLREDSADTASALLRVWRRLDDIARRAFPL